MPFFAILVAVIPAFCIRALALALWGRFRTGDDRFTQTRGLAPQGVVNPLEVPGPRVQFLWRVSASRSCFRISGFRAESADQFCSEIQFEAREDRVTGFNEAWRWRRAPLNLFNGRSRLESRPRPGLAAPQRSGAAAEP